jgi:hypothetical protein
VDDGENGALEWNIRDEACNQSGWRAATPSLALRGREAAEIRGNFVLSRRDGIKWPQLALPSGQFDQDRMAYDDQRKAASPDTADLDRAGLFREPAVQKQKAGFQVIFEVWKLHRRVQAELAVGEFGPTIPDVLAKHPPEKPTRDALDDVVVVDEDAVVVGVVFDFQDCFADALATRGFGR